PSLLLLSLAAGALGTLAACANSTPPSRDPAPADTALASATAPAPTASAAPVAAAPAADDGGAPDAAAPVAAGGEGAGAAPSGADRGRQQGRPDRGDRARGAREGALRGHREGRARARRGVLVPQGAVHPAQGREGSGQVLGAAPQDLRARRAHAAREAKVVGR